MADKREKGRIKQGYTSAHLRYFTFLFSDVTLPEVMFSVQAPLKTNQLHHRSQF